MKNGVYSIIVMSWTVNSQNVGSCNLVFRLLHCSVVTSHHNTSTVRSKLNHFRLPHAAKTPCHRGDQCLTDAISICFANVLQSNKIGKDRPMCCQSNNKFWLPVRTVCGSVRYHGPKLCFLNQWKCDIVLIRSNCLHKILTTLVISVRSSYFQALSFI